MQIGDTYEYKNVVTKEITAGALGSGGLDIFATPFLICWMEAAAYYYMKEQLPCLLYTSDAADDVITV